jgi:AcrR family transcriptional regulator
MAILSSMTRSDSASPKRRRRAVAPEERGREADRTRRRILDAALTEFGAKGYAGSRTAGIAARAGVNQQLIAYHFGGKHGLLEELRKQWADLERAVRGDGGTFEESVRGYLDATLDNPDWARLVVWQALGDGPPGGDQPGAPPGAVTPEADLGEALDRMRARQRSGELTADIDPRFVLLLAYLVAFAPIALPSIVVGIYGVDPLSPDYRREVINQLMDIVSKQSTTPKG